MAKQSQSTSSSDSRSFDKELVEDINDIHLPKNSWTQARNAINNSKTGDLGKLGNEPGNLYCSSAPYVIIGTIHLQADMWLIFSTNEVDSEIGVFLEDTCLYTLLVNDPCLNFSKKNLIIGTAKPTGDCTVDGYWEDNRNPSRYIRVNTTPPDYDTYIPWKQRCTDGNNVTQTSPGVWPVNYHPSGCITCENINELDCEKIRLAPHVKAPCITVNKGISSGTMLNGSYFVVAAYTINQLKITDYYSPSNVQSLFEHDNVAGSLDIIIESSDERFDEFELVLVSTVNQQTVARRLGIYSTRQTRITLDYINNNWTTVPIEEISLRNAVVEKAEAMYSIQDYLVRVGPTNKFDFNYQPLANQILTKWQAVEYPANYYAKGGNKTGYLRDEVYALFIRWVYDTGDKSASYHIPGRPKYLSDAVASGEFIPDDPTHEKWFCENTAKLDTITPYPNTVLSDGGIVVAQGIMGYWESEEYYQDNNSEVWNSDVLYTPYSAYGTLVQPANLALNLCGTRIRHHRMPDNVINGDGFGKAHHFANAGNSIRILGLEFENIKPPVMNPHDPIANQVLVPGIIGYEILRGSRQGNRSILAKGIINNMGVYNIDGAITPRLGLYQNYPYNDVNSDEFLSRLATSTPVINVTSTVNTVVKLNFIQNNFSNKSGIGTTEPVFSFHSPDTNFTHPFLSAKEIKSYGEYKGTPVGRFQYSEKHPKQKLVTNIAFLSSAIAGMGIAYLEMMGDTKSQVVLPNIPGYSQGLMPGWTFAGTAGNSLPGTIATSSGDQPTAIDKAAIIAAYNAMVVKKTTYEIDKQTFGADLLASLAGLRTAESAYITLVNNIAKATNTAPANKTPFTFGQTNIERSTGKFAGLPNVLRNIAIALSPTYLYYVSEGTDATLRVIKNMLRYRDFALKYNSHCFYNEFSTPLANQTRRELVTSNYIGPNIQDFGLKYRINNQYRNNFVALELGSRFNPINNNDNSRNIRIGKVGSASRAGGNTMKDPTLYDFSTRSNCAYVGLKQRLRNQYGQLNGILQVPVTTCVEYVNITNVSTSFNSPSLFNGDIYIGRYTEKTTFFYFYEWLFDQPNGYEFDYLKHRMLLYPTYWMNSENFETQDFTSSLISNTLQPVNWKVPSKYYALDTNITTFDKLQFSVRDSWFYLFNSGIRDFFVESEINVDLRDWGNTDSEKHYPLLDWRKDIFDTTIIKSGNYYKYDISLSMSNIYMAYTSWGNLQETYYDPYLAETCYVHRPKRVIYSLPANYESAKDYWRVFLPLNYKEFTARVSCIKKINKSGALILFDTDSPIQFQGSDTLETGLGTKLVIGDGALFAQPQQSMANTDSPYEYASCQNRLSVINTPAGAFWISQNQGKIFTTSNGLNEISGDNMKWWFAQYLPYILTQDFPNFDLIDNPVAGIGCQSIYDNLNGLLYFCKKDYTLRKDINDTVTYDAGKQSFYVNKITPIELGDPNYFIDASWTISYDPKSGGFIGYHDWHPDLLLPSKNTFMSISKTGSYKDINGITVNAPNSLWIHNERCDLYCNYYGVDYPFEVEYTINTGQTINTLRSVELIMEMYKYAPNCYDRYHVLNEFFDEATIYNTEQCSGLLKLELTPRNDLPLLISYPKINFTNIQVLYSKVENQYRFNMFWDVTATRGGQDVGIPGVVTFAQRTIWDTQPNGYVRILNSSNMNYQKNDLERKKFRHYTNSVLLRKLVSGDRKMLVMLSENKNLYSPR